MGAHLQSVIVVDVEATCWASKEEQGNRPNEVIEIGIVDLSLRDGKILKKGSYTVKPRFTTVSPFCTELTGWKQDDMDVSDDIKLVLPKIADDFRITKNHVWWSGGEYDRIKLSSNPKLGGSLGTLYADFAADWNEGAPEKNPFSFMRAHSNIKTLLAMKMKWKREKGLASSLAALGLSLDGRHHNGADDAENTAKLVWKLLS